MLTLYNPALPFERKTALMLGNFDGFHRGHRRLAEETVLHAKEKGLVPAAFCFLSPPDKGGKLTNEQEKAALLQEAGIQALFYYDFSLLSDLCAEEFVKTILLDTLNVSAVFCGFNYRFAKGRTADTETLRSLLSPRAELFVLPAVCDENGEAISSSKIRALIQSGDCQTAEKLLGHPIK